MYRFPCYWTITQRINFLQRVILIHSYLYYKKDAPMWQDRQYDEISKQLQTEQNKVTKEYIKHNTQYGYAFYDWDASTGFHLWERLEKQDREYLLKIIHLMKGE